MALQKASDLCKLWPSRSRRMGTSITLWLLANRMNISVNYMVPILLLVQPLGDITIAVILLERSEKEGESSKKPLSSKEFEGMLVLDLDMKIRT
jgi:hypothetical protein